MAPSAPPETAIAVLKEKHAATIALLKENMKDVLTNPVWDDIWLLRYCLSHVTAARAEEAARKTIKWRTEKAEILQAALQGKDPPFHDRIGKFAVADIHKTSKNNEPVYIIRAGLSNPDAAMAEVTEEQCIDWLLYHRELAYIQCNAATRRTGHLVKLIVVNDLNFVTISNDGMCMPYNCIFPDRPPPPPATRINKKLLRANLAAGKLSNEYFPQLLGKAIVVNPPKVFNMIFATIKPLIPKKTLDKVKICPGRTLKDTADKCPYIRANFDLDDLPTFLGGRCTCHDRGGCINGVANDQRSPNLEMDEDGMCKKTISTRSKHQIFLEVDTGAKVEYVFEVEKSLMSSSSVEFSASVKCGQQETVVLAVQKYKADDGQVKGEFVCPQAGTCIVTFENHAMMVTKTVRYSVGAVEVVDDAVTPDDSVSLAAASNIGEDMLERRSQSDVDVNWKPTLTPTPSGQLPPSFGQLPEEDEFVDCEANDHIIVSAEANGTAK